MNSDMITTTSSDVSRTESKEEINLAVLITSVGVGIFMASLDGTIVNVSLPVIAENFGIEQNAVQWVVLAYLLTLIGFTTIAGDLGDRYSNKLILQIGSVMFTVGSLLCAFSTTLFWLVLARILQALGACGGMANGTAIITRFTNNKNRGKALGFNAVILAAGITVGPILGGILTDNFGWQSIFLINVPLGVAALTYVQFAIPETPPLQKSDEMDIIGSISFMLFLTLFVFSLTVFVDKNIPNSIWWGVISITTSCIMFVVFFFWEKQKDQPVIDLTMFKNRIFAFGIISAVLAFMGLNVVFYQLPFYLKDIQNLVLLRIGLIIVGTPLTMAIVGPLAGKLSDDIDCRYPASLGMLGIAFDMILLAIFLTETTPYWFFFIASIVLGISLGLFLSPNSNSIMSTAPKEKLGVASSLLNLSTNVGFSLGTALSTAFFTILKLLFQKRNNLSTEHPSNYIPAMKAMFGIFAVIVFIAAIISYLRGSETEGM